MKTLPKTPMTLLFSYWTTLFCRINTILVRVGLPDVGGAHKYNSLNAVQGLSVVQYSIS